MDVIVWRWKDRSRRCYFIRNKGQVIIEIHMLDHFSAGIQVLQHRHKFRVVEKDENGWLVGGRWSALERLRCQILAGPVAIKERKGILVPTKIGGDQIDTGSQAREK